jgi:hypothetical protein
VWDIKDYKFVAWDSKNYQNVAWDISDYKNIAWDNGDNKENFHETVQITITRKWDSWDITLRKFERLNYN